MRVLLVKSRSLVTKVSGITPPLGVMSLAAYLRERIHADVRILDLKFASRPLHEVREAIAEFAPDVLGISALTPEAHLMKRIASSARLAAPALPILVGGPHPTAFPEETLDHPDVDAAVIGEGEETLLELVERIGAEGPRWKNPASLSAVRGIAFRPEPDAPVVRTEPRPFIDDLDALPFPAWDLVDLRLFWRRGSMASIGIRPYMTVFTSRGCPYHCAYCHSIFGKRFRKRSPESVVEEIRQIETRLGVRDIEVLDDIANLDRKRLDGILERLLASNLHPALSFPNGVRTDLLEEGTMDLLKQVGTGEVSVAIETASPRLQEMVHKKLDLDRVRLNLERLAARRIFTRGFFMLGFPTESEAEMRATIAFACRSPLHLALFFTVNPFKGTELHAEYAARGKLNGSRHTIDYEYFGAPFNGSDVPDARFRQLYRAAYRRFYLNPLRMARIARDRPHFIDIPRRMWTLATRVASFRRLHEPEPMDD